MTERALAEALRALAESAKGQQAPERVEAALLEAFARRGEYVRPARVAWQVKWAVAAALAGMMVAGAVWMRHTPVVDVPHPAPPAQIAAVAPAPVRPVEAAPRAERVRPRRKPVRRVASPPPPVEVATQYYPLRYGESAAEAARGPVVRVQVPRTTLASFGLPMDQDRADEPVEADVALDETGFARAIRFVRAQ